VAVCGSNDLQIFAVDPTSGDSAQIADFSAPSNGQLTVNCGSDPNSALVRQPHDDILDALNPTMTKLAVTLSASGPNGGNDVGYEENGGQTVDVTTATSPSGGDFTSAPDDEDPAFLHGTDQLWFSRAKQVMSIDTDNSASRPTPHPGYSTDSDAVDATRYYQLSYSHISPDGAKWVTFFENEGPMASLPCARAGSCSTRYGMGVFPTKGATDDRDTGATPLQVYAFPSSYNGTCDPWGWITATSWLCWNQGDTNPIEVISAGTGGLLIEGTPIPVESNRTNFDPVLSPDRSKIAFDSCGQDGCNLFSVPISGQTPTKIGALPGEDSRATTTALLEWLP
jgi:hypothetical protein